MSVGPASPFVLVEKHGKCGGMERPMWSKARTWLGFSRRCSVSRTRSDASLIGDPSASHPTLVRTNVSGQPANSPSRLCAPVGLVIGLSLTVLSPVAGASQQDAARSDLSTEERWRIRDGEGWSVDVELEDREMYRDAETIVKAIRRN